MQYVCTGFWVASLHTTMCLIVKKQNSHKYANILIISISQFKPFVEQHGNHNCKDKTFYSYKKIQSRKGVKGRLTFGVTAVDQL